MKLYVLVRSDLSKSQRIVQACHAVAEHCLKIGSWENNTVVILRVPSERKLNEVNKELIDRGYEPVVYKEPHFKLSKTALAVCGDDLGLWFSKFSLL